MNNPVPITEFTEIEPDSVHLVDRGANGFPVLIAKAANAEVDAILAATERAMDRLDAHLTKADDGVDCPTCNGSGSIREGNMECPDCGGGGTVSQDKADELGKATAPSGAETNEPGDCPTCKGQGVIFGTGTAGGEECPDCGGTGKDQTMTNPEELNAVDGDAGTSTTKAVIPDDDGIPGSPSWEAADAARLNEATQTLLDLKASIDLAADRENTEGTTGDPDDLVQAWTLQDASNMLTNLLGYIAAMAALEQREADDKSALAATKAGKRLSNTSVAALATARDHLNALLGDDDPAKQTDDDGEADTAQKDVLDMTKDELFELLDEHDARKAVAINDETVEVADDTVAETTDTESAEKSVDEDETGEAESDTAATTAQELDEARKALAELTARLEMVEKMAAPGGPSRMRTTEAIKTAAVRDARLIQADEYERTGFSQSDPDLRKGYLDKARELRRELNATTND